MKLIIIFVLIAIVASDEDINGKFEKFVKKHGKKFNSKEQAEKALFYFTKNQKYIDEHNARHAAGLEDFNMTTYHFMDDNIQVFLNATCGAKHPARTRALPQSTQPDASTYPAGPAAIDFTSSCLPVPASQGGCGSCWTFATAAHLESLYKRKNGANVTPLSEQYLVDCDSKNSGCNGGWPKEALDFIKANKIPANSAYPYTAVQGSCKSVAKLNLPAICQTFEYDLNGNENQLKNILAASGPVVVLVSATNAFGAYRSGVFSDSTCPTECYQTNHAVLLVGYGVDAGTGKSFWKIRNSWGADWGENGYIRMARGNNNNCLTSCSAVFAKLC